MSKSDLDASTPRPAPDSPDDKETVGWKRNALGWGAVAAIASAALAIAANLSEIAGWFESDETREIVEQTRVAMQDTDEKVDELLVLLRNQAAAAGFDLNIESETTIRNAVQAIVASSNAQKRVALNHLDSGDVAAAADVMAKVAANQATAVSETSSAAAETWREAGALYYTFDMQRAVGSYYEANRLQPGHAPTMDMLAYALVRAGELDKAGRIFNEILTLDVSPIETSSAHSGLGYIAKQRGDYPAADRHYRTALETASARRISEEYIVALASLGELELARGDFNAAIQSLRQALPYAEEGGHKLMRAKVLSSLGTVAARQARFDDAESLMQQALAIQEGENDLAGRTNTLGNLGAVSLSRRDYESAETRILESSALSERLGWQSSLAYDLVNLAAIASAKGEFDSADERLSRAQAIAADVGLNELMPIIIFNRGEVARDAGDFDTACQYWLAALPILVDMRSMHVSYAESQIQEAACEQREVLSGPQPSIASE